MKSRHSALLIEPPLPLVCADFTTSDAHTPRNERRNHRSDRIGELQAVQNDPRRVYP